LSDGEVRRIKVYEDERVVRLSKLKSKTTQTRNKRVTKVDGLDTAIKKQKAFINGEKFW
jgi:hypothetical protein